MNYTVPGLILLVVIAAVCGAIGRPIAGGVRGGLIVSTALGFVGAVIGPWVAARLQLAEPFTVNITGIPSRCCGRSSAPRSSWRSFTCSRDGR